MEKKEIKKEITYRTLKWGPCVINLTADDKLIKSLLAEAEKSTVSYGDRLAGHLKKEVKLDPTNYTKYFNEMFTVYNHALGLLLGTNEAIPFIVSDLWCNFQKANEFNPPHYHTGSLSFVIYLKVPEILRKECEKHQNNKKGTGPGCISFFIGDSDRRNSVTQNSFFPGEGEIFIFPSWLKHWVYPFKSDCTRVSVSGNVQDSVELKYLSEKGAQLALEDVRRKDEELAKKFDWTDKPVEKENS